MTVEEHALINGDEVTVFARVRSHLTHVEAVSLATQPSSAVHRRNGKALISNTCVEEAVKGAGHISHYDRISISNFLPEPENTLATLDALAAFDLYVWSSRGMVMVPNYIDAI